MYNSTTIIYDEIVKAEQNVQKALSVAEDFPPFYFDGYNEQLTHDLNDAQLTLSNARNFIVLGSAFNVTTEPDAEQNAKKHKQNNDALDDERAEDLNEIYYNGAYKEQLTHIAKKQIAPNRITYYIIDSDDNICWFGDNIDTAVATFRRYKNGLIEEDDAEEDNDVTYILTSGKDNIYYNGLMIDFDEVIERFINFKMFNENDELYGDMNELLLNVRDTVREYRTLDIDERINGYKRGKITVRLCG